ncbi:MAG: hypothetical protein EON47_15595, partial [Acetobacteraceae bacterium]
MKLFRCQACDQVLYFENTRCERSGHRLGYMADLATLSALEPEPGGEPSGETAAHSERWTPLARTKEAVVFCANAAHDACNWLVPADGPEALCASCRHQPVAGVMGRIGAEDDGLLCPGQR